jgi:hypothetical protein
VPEDRRRKIARLLLVQDRMHQLAELKLARLAQRRSEIDAARVDLIHALNDDGAFNGLFVDAIARRLEKLAREAEHVDRAKAEQAKRVLAEARRMKTTERLSGRLDREARRAREKVDFNALLEAFAQLDDASFT